MAEERTEQTETEEIGEGGEKPAGLDAAKAAIAKLNQGPGDLLCIDTSGDQIAAVRMRKSGSRKVLTAAALLPHPPSETDEDGVTETDPLAVPGDLRAPHVSMCVAADHAIIKLLSFPGAFDESDSEQIVSSMGLDDPETQRIGYKLVSAGRGRTESKVLAVAMPHTDAEAVLELFPAGRPAPYSIEVSGLAAMSAFLNVAYDRHGEDSFGILDFGKRVTYFALFVNAQLSIVRKFNFGSEGLIEGLQQQLGIDRETALGTLTAGSIDLSEQFSATLEPLAKQLIISRDFVERRHNTRIEAIYASGGVPGTDAWRDPIQDALGTELLSWNPFDAVETDGAHISDEAQQQPTLFAAVIGAGLGTFEET